MTTAAKLLSNLLTYVAEQSKVIDPNSFRLAGHRGFLKQKTDLRGLPGVFFDMKVAGDHVWLKVQRLESHSPPAVEPEKMRSFLAVSDDPNGKPPAVNDVAVNHRLTAMARGLDGEKQREVLADLRSQAERALKQYTPLWNAWAEGEKPRRRTIDFYGDLFALKHQLEADETAKPQELVWGLGVAAWTLKHPEAGKGPVDFQYPLITQPLEISIEEDTLAISLRPRSLGPRLEFDAFAACQVPGAAEVERSARQVLDKPNHDPVSPFDLATYHPVLKIAVAGLQDRARWQEGPDSLPQPGDDLVVTDAWVLLSRPRSNNYLFEDLARLRDRILQGVDIPEGTLALVTPPSEEPPEYGSVSFRGLSGVSGSTSGASGEARELFFPLPYNHEQVTIIEQLERSEGVVVQGPPGTGKTHTIANIVSHYLATGRKVLVTSKGEQALQVLQSKIPEEVRPLTVALLAGDREGLRQFQTSIEAIIHNLSHLNPEVVRTEIETQLSAINQAHSELANIDRRVDDIAQSQLSDIEVDGVTMRAQKMAELVLAGREQHGWFDDALTLDARHAPPATGSEASACRDARRRLGADLVYTQARLPSSLSLPAAADLGELHGVLVSMRNIEQAEATGGLPALRATTPEVLNMARKLLQDVEAAARLARELEESGQVWTFELRRKCRQVEFTSERLALEALFGEIEELNRARAEFLKSPVELPEPALGQVKFREAVQRASETGKPFGLFVLGAGDAKEHVSAVRVSGLAPANVEDWRHVLRYLKLHERVHSFSVRWNQFSELMSAPRVQGSVTRLRELELVTSAALKAHHLATRYDAHLPALAEQVFAQPLLAQLRGTSADLNKVREHLRTHLSKVELARAATQLATLQEKLAGTTGPVSQMLRRFVERDLGDPQQTADRVVAQYAEHTAELRRVESLASDLRLVNDIADRFDKAGASKFAARVRSEPVDASGEDLALPVSWREAWNWARVKAHLEAIEAREELVSLAARRRDLEAGLAKLYENMVAKSAWRSTKLAASPKVLSALETYRTAVQRIGQGTGPNAVRHRRDAQRAMHDAQGAVPCWVMSHSKVSETLPAILGSFDLVIVDEASQSDLWALPALLRGKKVLVVGDDKQVSPDAGFVASTRIQELKDRFLSDQPYAAMLTPEKSLYDIASTVYAANKVMLREHFRCVPAIIAYSNHFYNGFMQPLRIPKASERIDPPLVDLFVPSGYRERDLNRPEGEAILSEIQAILADKRFAGRSLGVVSLLGADQAKHIDTLVRSRCDAAELMRRNFECGDARVFQGSERDIMFLSMVADPLSHKALSGNTFEQRFNVAASRARDRMYLVRSVQLKDLSTLDLRAGLLQHFSRPVEGSTDESKSLINLCESGFERQVYSALFDRGFRVVPQVRAGAFRIDMVVEGANDTRLAIECDGDEFHGPDRWAADMNRQRVLERAGWTFWRCFASTWSIRKDEVLQELLERLASLGIEPLGTLDKIPALVEYREWQPPSAEEEDSDDLTAQALEAAITAAKASTLLP